MTFAHPLPWWGLLLVLTGIVLVARIGAGRLGIHPTHRRVLEGLRSATLLLLVLFLMRPVRTVQGTATRTVVPILIDASRSMGVADAADTPRIERARDLVARELIPRLGREFDVDVLAFGESVRAVAAADVSATDRRTDLDGALAATAERYRGRAVPGIVLLSDGGESAAGAGPKAAVPMPPVFAFGFGSPTNGNDREILSATVADTILDDSRVDLDVVAVSHGHGDEPMALRLLENGRPIEVRRVSPAGDGIPVHERFHVAPRQASATVYTVEVPVAGGELVPENNGRSVLVQPPSRVRRVLFVEGAPGFEHSFLKRAWSGDKGLEVDTVVRKGKNEEGRDTFYIQASGSRANALATGYPQRLEDLFTYDALVLANVEAAQLTRAELEATRTFVGRRGGGLLVLGSRSLGKSGLANTPIGEVLPLQFSEAADAVLPVATTRGINVLSLTADGQAHPVMELGASSEDTEQRWASAPPLGYVVPLGGPRPGATILAVAAGTGGAPHALLAVQRYGEGRAMIFTGEGAWRWRMLLPSTDRSYETFWRQALRWIALPAGDPVALQVPAARSPGEPLEVGVRVRTPAFEPRVDAAVEVFVTNPGGRVDRVQAGKGTTPGAFVARFTPEHAGVYRVAAEARSPSVPFASAATMMLVGGADTEMADPRLNMQALRRVALESGGRVIGSAGRDGADALLDALRAGVPAARLSATQDVWHNGVSFAIVLALLATEWVLRRRWGLR